jgi:hypothetical protein
MVFIKQATETSGHLVMVNNNIIIKSKSRPVAIGFEIESK